MPRGDVCSLQLTLKCINRERDGGTARGMRRQSESGCVRVRMQLCQPSYILGNSRDNMGERSKGKYRVSLSTELGSRGKGRQDTSLVPSCGRPTGVAGSLPQGWCFGVQ